MQRPIDDTPMTTRVMTHSVDMQTANKFTVTKKLKTWLRNHPNFKRNNDTGQYTHIYEDEFTQYKEQVDEQRRRESLSVEGAEDYIKGEPASAEIIPSGTEGPTTTS